MPLYEYQCSKCGEKFEVLQKFSDAPLKRHKGCRGALHRLVSAAGLHFKGSGWYVNDYATKSAGKSEGKSESSGDSKAESQGSESSLRNPSPPTQTPNRSPGLPKPRPGLRKPRPNRSRPRPRRRKRNFPASTFVTLIMKTLLLTAVGTIAAWGQTQPVKWEFEVASVRPSAPQSAENQVNIGLHLDGSQARIASFTFKDYVAMAYRVKAYQISGPDWTGTDRFDLNAKLPAGATSDQIPEMLQALLADRFQLKFHREKKELPVYALVLGKEPQVRSSSRKFRPALTTPTLAAQSPTWRHRAAAPGSQWIWGTALPIPLRTINSKARS